MAGHPPSPLVALPLPLVHSTVAFAIDDSSTTLSTLAHVSREWHALVQNVDSFHKLKSFTVTAAAVNTRSKLLKARQEVTLRRAHFRELHVDASEGTVHPLDVGTALFAHTRRLEMLSIDYTIDVFATG